MPTVDDARPVLELLQRLNAATSGRHLARLEDEGLNLTHYRVLAVVGRTPGLGVKALADHLALSPAATSRAIDTLVQRDLLVRDEHAADRRHRLLALTAAGTALLGRLDAARHEDLAAFLTRLPDPARHGLADAARLALTSLPSPVTEESLR
jgi:DNA-binding MarR family transcriptional regulator